MHLQSLNPLIEVNGRIAIFPSEIVDLSADSDHSKKNMFAGVSSFGSGGSNAHVIVQRYNPSCAPPDANLVGGLRSPVASTPRICFMYTGQATEYPNMGVELYSSNEVFRRTIDRYYQIIKIFSIFSRKL